MHDRRGSVLRRTAVLIAVEAALVLNPSVAALAGPDESPKGKAAESFATVERYAFAMLQLRRMHFLQADDVHRTLSLTQAQIQLFRREGPELTRLMGRLQSVPAAKRELTIEREFIPQAERFQKLIDRELNARQSSQLLRRVVQEQHGALVLLFPGIPEHLQLTPEQHTVICGIVNQNLKLLSQDGFNNPRELIQLVGQAANSRRAAENVLTSEQRARWKSLLKK